MGTTRATTNDNKDDKHDCLATTTTTTATTLIGVVGLVLGLVSTNLCALLLVLNAAGWWNIVHVDVTALEELAAATWWKAWQPYTQAMTWACMVAVLVGGDQQGRVAVGGGSGSHRRGRVVMVLVMMVVLALPHALIPYRDAHPILRRSLLAVMTPTTTMAPEQTVAIVGQDDSSSSLSSSSPSRPVTQIHMLVEHMTCGGCGGYVRNLIDKYNPELIEKTHVDWKSGNVWIHGSNLGTLDRAGLAQLLTGEGYPATVLDDE